MWRLGGQSVILERRKQADNASRKDTGRLGQAVRRRNLDPGELVEATSRLHKLALIAQTPKIDSGNSCGHEVSRPGNTALPSDFERARLEGGVGHARDVTFAR